MKNIIIFISLIALLIEYLLCNSSIKADDNKYYSSNNINNTSNNSPRQIKASTCDSPLYIGEVGCCYALNTIGDLDVAVVSLNNIYTDTQALNIVKSKHGRKESPKAGTHFEVAEIETSLDPAKDYIDVKFQGLDGKRLVYNDTSYTTRCYDLEPDGYTIWVYYEVPDGCEVYNLQIGETPLDVVIDTTNYRVFSPNFSITKAP